MFTDLGGLLHPCQRYALKSTFHRTTSMRGSTVERRVLIRFSTLLILN